MIPEAISAKGCATDAAPMPMPDVLWLCCLLAGIALLIFTLTIDEEDLSWSLRSLFIMVMSAGALIATGCVGIILS